MKVSREEIAARAQERRGQEQRARSVSRTTELAGLTAGSVVVGHNVQTQESSYALGAQASEAAIQKMVTQTGFTRLRRITATPCAFVFEARRS